MTPVGAFRAAVIASAVARLTSSAPAQRRTYFDIGWARLSISLVNGASFAARSTLADALTDAGLLAVALAPAMRGLTYLDASFCDGITDLSLEAIGAHLRRLRVLKLACCTSGVTDAGVASLTPLEELEELDLSGLARLTPRSLGHLAELPGLKRWALPRQLQARASPAGL